MSGRLAGNVWSGIRVGRHAGHVQVAAIAHADRLDDRVRNR